MTPFWRKSSGTSWRAVSSAARAGTTAHRTSSAAAAKTALPRDRQEPQAIVAPPLFSKRQDAARIVDQHGVELGLAEPLFRQPRHKAVEQPAERHPGVLLVGLLGGDRPAAVAEKAVVGKDDPVDVAAIDEPADQDRELLVQFLGAVVHPRDPDMVDLEHGAAPAQRVELLELREDEDVAHHDLAGVGPLFFEDVEHLDARVRDLVV